jgi:3',5'-cyclic AMP phosphodiesterase CpdA
MTQGGRVRTSSTWKARYKAVTLTSVLAAFMILGPLAILANADVVIGVIGDQFGVNGTVGTPEFNNNLKASYQALADGIVLLNKLGPMDVVIHVGDLVESAMTKNDIKENFNDAVALLNTLSSKSKPKWFLTPGDHDVNPLAWSPNSSDHTRERFFQSLYAEVNPAATEHLYYSFDINGYHFIALYSLEHLDTDPRWGNIFFAKISDEQLGWLRKDLARADTRKGVIVFTHQPLWYNWSSWLQVHKLLAKYNTKLVLAGHTHYDESDDQLDGIQYRIVGATGGAIKNANAAAGGWWHVSRVTIKDDGSVSWQLIPLGNYTKGNFTDRYDMERIQALDYNLGNAAQWLSQQVLFVKDGKLLDQTCQPTSTPTITLSDFGNPIDESVSVDISPTDTAKYKILSGQFAPGVCETGQTNTGCIVKANANIAISNGSMVTALCSEFTADNLYCTKFRPFWSGVISPVNTPQAKDKITFTITVLYTSKNNETWKIWKKMPVNIEACP